jgi:uncharacterized membrane protein YfcA
MTVDFADPATLAVIIATFVLAGAIKGVIGLGLPIVSVAVLTATLGLPAAMGLLLVPAFVTNLWQAATGGNGRMIFARCWPFLLAATATVWIGALALSNVDLRWLSALLGVLLVVYGAIGLTAFRITVPPRHSTSIGVALGLVNGLFTGMTGSFSVPGVMYLQAIGLPRDALIQAMGMLFTASAAALALALQRNALITSDLALASLASVVPALMGMRLGQAVRQSLSEPAFRRLFHISLSVLGLLIITRALLASG